MTETPNAPPRPTASSPSQINAWLDYAYAELAGKRDAILPVLRGMLNEHGKCTIPDGDDHTAGIVAQNVAIAEAIIKRIEDRRKIEKADFLEAGKAVDDWKKAFCLQLEQALTPINNEQLRYAREKIDRERRVREAEELAARLAAQAAQAEAQKAMRKGGEQTAAALQKVVDTANAHEHAQARAQERPSQMGAVVGIMGGRSAPRRKWRWRLNSLTQLLSHILDGEVSSKAVTVNEDWIREEARERDPVTNKPTKLIPGIVWEEELSIGRARARG